MFIKFQFCFLDAPSLQTLASLGCWPVIIVGNSRKLMWEHSQSFLSLGTLGRQGNPAILTKLKTLIGGAGRKYFIVLLSEITPAKLDMMPSADAWVQIACPRLSIDWGHFFSKPVLSPYEANVALGEAVWKEDEYPMDFYEKGDSPWSNFGLDNAERTL